MLRDCILNIAHSFLKFIFVSFHGSYYIYIVTCKRTRIKLNYWQLMEKVHFTAGSTILPGVDRYEWLEESEPSRDFYLVGSTYMGPKILDH